MTLHPLKVLRIESGMSQALISRATGISTARLSLAENRLGSLSAAEEEAVRAAILRAANDRYVAVLELAGVSEAQR